ncbi:lysozyme inhibitor LprI family protein [Variovorax sp. KK3]|uniref:lysozyme inhibitor LprI family protein n=1 Tax=Variovorax sp. KK3 TaxID=1855728 RepID=UPI00097BC272|nr:lysozyme inhibitor LprI family protein [Variovorax sp. KK3]
MTRHLCFGLALLLLLFLLPDTVFAQSEEPCRTRTTVEINQCAQQTLARRDRELNDAYQSLLKSLSPHGKEDAVDYAGTRRLLQQAQRAWMQFRDSDCRAKYLRSAGGSVRDIAALGCQIAHTELRTRQLREWNRA